MKYCYSCRKNTPYSVERTQVHWNEYTYKSKRAICKICNLEVYDRDIDDKNLENLNKVRSINHKEKDNGM